MMAYRRYLEVRLLVKTIAEEIGGSEPDNMKLKDNVYRLPFAGGALRISLYEDYKERSLAKPAPVIFLEDENHREWVGKISFERMSNEQIRSAIAYFLEQFKKENNK